MSFIEDIYCIKHAFLYLKEPLRPLGASLCLGYNRTTNLPNLTN